jgi:hypothetical protein
MEMNETIGIELQIPTKSMRYATALLQSLFVILAIKGLKRPVSCS